MHECSQISHINVLKNEQQNIKQDVIYIRDRIDIYVYMMIGTLISSVSTLLILTLKG